MFISSSIFFIFFFLLREISFVFKLQLKSTGFDFFFQKNKENNGSCWECSEQKSEQRITPLKDPLATNSHPTICFSPYSQQAATTHRLLRLHTFTVLMLAYRLTSASNNHRYYTRRKRQKRKRIELCVWLDCTSSLTGELRSITFSSVSRFSGRVPPARNKKGW